MKVLIVEDEKDIVEILNEFITELGHTTDVCFDGIDGYVKVQQNNYDVVITDIMMETMNGNEMIDLIKKANKDVKIIVISAIENEKDVQIIKNLGIDMYIEKPFSLLEVQSALKNLLPENNGNTFTS